MSIPFENTAPLHQQWKQTAPHFTVDAFGIKHYDRGGKNLTKMLQFKEAVNLGNAEIDEYLAMNPQRQESETDKDLKIRSAFQKALVKFRGYIYEFPKTEKKVSTKSLKHASK